MVVTPAIMLTFQWDIGITNETENAMVAELLIVADRLAC